MVFNVRVMEAEVSIFESRTTAIYGKIFQPKFTLISNSSQVGIEFADWHRSESV